MRNIKLEWLMSRKILKNYDGMALSTIVLFIFITSSGSQWVSYGQGPSETLWTPNMPASRTPRAGMSQGRRFQFPSSTLRPPVAPPVIPPSNKFNQNAYNNAQNTYNSGQNSGKIPLPPQPRPRTQNSREEKKSRRNFEIQSTLRVGSTARPVSQQAGQLHDSWPNTNAHHHLSPVGPHQNSNWPTKIRLSNNPISVKNNYMQQNQFYKQPHENIKEKTISQDDLAKSHLTASQKEKIMQMTRTLTKLSPKKPINVFMRYEGIEATRQGADVGQVIKKYAGSSKVPFFNGTLPLNNLPTVFLAPEDMTPPYGYGKIPIPSLKEKNNVNEKTEHLITAASSNNIQQIDPNKRVDNPQLQQGNQNFNPFLGPASMNPPPGYTKILLPTGISGTPQPQFQINKVQDQNLQQNQNVKTFNGLNIQEKLKIYNLLKDGKTPVIDNNNAQFLNKNVQNNINFNSNQNVNTQQSQNINTNLFQNNPQNLNQQNFQNIQDQNLRIFSNNKNINQNPMFQPNTQNNNNHQFHQQNQLLQNQNRDNQLNFKTGYKIIQAPEKGVSSGQNSSNWLLNALPKGAIVESIQTIKEGGERQNIQLNDINFSPSILNPTYAKPPTQFQPNNKIFTNQFNQQQMNNDYRNGAKVVVNPGINVQIPKIVDGGFTQSELKHIIGDIIEKTEGPRVETTPMTKFEQRPVWNNWPNQMQNNAINLQQQNQISQNQGVRNFEQQRPSNIPFNKMPNLNINLLQNQNMNLNRIKNTQQQNLAISQETPQLINQGSNLQMQSSNRQTINNLQKQTLVFPPGRVQNLFPSPKPNQLEKKFRPQNNPVRERPQILIPAPTMPTTARPSNYRDFDHHNAQHSQTNNNYQTDFVREKNNQMSHVENRPPQQQPNKQKTPFQAALSMLGIQSTIRPDVLPQKNNIERHRKPIPPIGRRPQMKIFSTTTPTPKTTEEKSDESNSSESNQVEVKESISPPNNTYVIRPPTKNTKGSHEKYRRPTIIFTGGANGEMPDIQKIISSLDKLESNSESEEDKNQNSKSKESKKVMITTTETQQPKIHYQSTPKPILFNPSSPISIYQQPTSVPYFASSTGRPMIFHSSFPPSPFQFISTTPSYNSIRPFISTTPATFLVTNQSPGPILLQTQPSPGPNIYNSPLPTQNQSPGPILHQNQPSPGPTIYNSPLPIQNQSPGPILHQNQPSPGPTIYNSPLPTLTQNQGHLVQSQTRGPQLVSIGSSPSVPIKQTVPNPTSSQFYSTYTPTASLAQKSPLPTHYQHEQMSSFSPTSSSMFNSSTTNINTYSSGENRQKYTEKNQNELDKKIDNNQYKHQKDKESSEEKVIEKVRTEEKITWNGSIPSKTRTEERTIIRPNNKSKNNNNNERNQDAFMNEDRYFYRNDNKAISKEDKKNIFETTTSASFSDLLASKLKFSLLNESPYSKTEINKPTSSSFENSASNNSHFQSELTEKDNKAQELSYLHISTQSTPNQDSNGRHKIKPGDLLKSEDMTPVFSITPPTYKISSNEKLETIYPNTVNYNQNQKNIDEINLKVDLKNINPSQQSFYRQTDNDLQIKNNQGSQTQQEKNTYAQAPVLSSNQFSNEKIMFYISTTQAPSNMNSERLIFFPSSTMSPQNTYQETTSQYDGTKVKVQNNEQIFVDNQAKTLNNETPIWEPFTSINFKNVSNPTLSSNLDSKSTIITTTTEKISTTTKPTTTMSQMEITNESEQTKPITWRPTQTQPPIIEKKNITQKTYPYQAYDRNQVSTLGAETLHAMIAGMRIPNDLKEKITYNNKDVGANQLYAFQNSLTMPYVQHPLMPNIYQHHPYNPLLFHSSYPQLMPIQYLQKEHHPYIHAPNSYPQPLENTQLNYHNKNMEEDERSKYNLHHMTKETDSQYAELVEISTTPTSLYENRPRYKNKFRIPSQYIRQNSDGQNENNNLIPVFVHKGRKNKVRKTTTTTTSTTETPYEEYDEDDDTSSLDQDAKLEDINSKYFNSEKEMNEKEMKVNTQFNEMNSRERNFLKENSYKNQNLDINYVPLYSSENKQISNNQNSNSKQFSQPNTREKEDVTNEETVYEIRVKTPTVSEKTKGKKFTKFTSKSEEVYDDYDINPVVYNVNFKSRTKASEHYTSTTPLSTHLEISKNKESLKTHSNNRERKRKTTTTSKPDESESESEEGQEKEQAESSKHNDRDSAQKRPIYQSPNSRIDYNYEEQFPVSNQFARRTPSQTFYDNSNIFNKDNTHVEHNQSTQHAATEESKYESKNKQISNNHEDSIRHIHNNYPHIQTENHNRPMEQNNFENQEKHSYPTKSVSVETSHSVIVSSLNSSATPTKDNDYVNREMFELHGENNDETDRASLISAEEKDPFRYSVVGNHEKTNFGMSLLKLGSKDSNIMREREPLFEAGQKKNFVSEEPPYTPKSTTTPSPSSTGKDSKKEISTSTTKAPNNEEEDLKNILKKLQEKLKSSSFSEYDDLGEADLDYYNEDDLLSTIIEKPSAKSSSKIKKTSKKKEKDNKTKQSKKKTKKVKTVVKNKKVSKKPTLKTTPKPKVLTTKQTSITPKTKVLTTKQTSTTPKPTTKPFIKNKTPIKPLSTTKYIKPTEATTQLLTTTEIIKPDIISIISSPPTHITSKNELDKSSEHNKNQSWFRRRVIKTDSQSPLYDNKNTIFINNNSTQNDKRRIRLVRRRRPIGSVNPDSIKLSNYQNNEARAEALTVSTESSTLQSSSEFPPHDILSKKVGELAQPIKRRLKLVRKGNSAQWKLKVDDEQKLSNENLANNVGEKSLRMESSMTVETRVCVRGKCEVVTKN